MSAIYEECILSISNKNGHLFVHTHTKILCFITFNFVVLIRCVVLFNMRGEWKLNWCILFVGFLYVVNTRESGCRLTDNVVGKTIIKIMVLYGCLFMLTVSDIYTFDTHCERLWLKSAKLCLSSPISVFEHVLRWYITCFKSSKYWSIDWKLATNAFSVRQWVLSCKITLKTF